MLACQRKGESDHPFEWEFPGGKIEQGETAEQCIIREIKEELDIEISVEKMLKAVDFDYPNKRITLIPFLCKRLSGLPKALDHNDLKWIDIGSYDELKWAEADKKLIINNLSSLGCLH